MEQKPEYKWEFVEGGATGEADTGQLSMNECVHLPWPNFRHCATTQTSQFNVHGYSILLKLKEMDYTQDNEKNSKQR